MNNALVLLCIVASVPTKPTVISSNFNFPTSTTSFPLKSACVASNVNSSTPLILTACVDPVGVLRPNTVPILDIQ